MNGLKESVDILPFDLSSTWTFFETTVLLQLVELKTCASWISNSLWLIVDIQLLMSLLKTIFSISLNILEITPIVSFFKDFLEFFDKRKIAINSWRY